jgi:pyruvate/2-oxoglutarate dehydrogenase complex dihydrolipoamide acyltransferase (E2) component
MKKDLFIPKHTSNDESVKINEWLVQDKEFIKSGQNILIIETSKTTVEIESDFSGYLHKKSNVNDTVMVGGCFATIYESLDDIGKSLSENKEYTCSDNNHSNNNSKFSNAALKYLQENQLDPSLFIDVGLVTVEKIKAKLEKKIDSKFKLNQEIFPNAAIESLSFAKLTEISNLIKSKDNAVTSSLTVQFNSEEIRKSLSELTWLNRRVLPYILYIFSRMLAKNPRFTSYYDDKKICCYNRINLGLAIDLEKDLKIVVIKDSDSLSLFDLQMSIFDSITCYHEETLDLASLNHSTFTVTDLSQDNIFHFQPILNANQAIILGIGGDQSLPGSPMTLTIVFDHRILSGQEVATFLKEFKDRLLKEHSSIAKENR